MTTLFEKDQEVVNDAKPEWGIGKILDVELTPDKKAQRVRVRFGGVGMKKLLIPPGKLSLANQPVESPSSSNVGDVSLGNDNVSEFTAEKFIELPEVIFDSRYDFETRMTALLECYRFTNSPKDVFDWTVLKTGNKDPLSLFSADELKSHFESYARKRDWAMREFYREIAKAGMKEKFDLLLKRKVGFEVQKQIRKLIS